MLQHAVLLDILQHPVAAHVLLHATGDAVQAPVVAHHRPAELRDIVLEINQILALLVRDDIVEVDVLVAPLEVVNDPLVCQLLLHDEDVLKEVDDSLIDVEVVKFGNHRLLIL